MSTIYTTRPSVTTTYTITPRTGDYHYLTWDESTDTWNSTLTWDTWATGTPATTFTPRIIP